MSATDRVTRAVPKEYKPLVRTAMRSGWTAGFDGHGHVRLTGPAGNAVTVPSSSRNSHTYEKVRRALRQAGVIQ